MRIGKVKPSSHYWRANTTKLVSALACVLYTSFLAIEGSLPFSPLFGWKCVRSDVMRGVKRDNAEVEAYQPKGWELYLICRHFFLRKVGRV